MPSLTTCQRLGWHDWSREQDATERGAFTVWVCCQCGLELGDDERDAEDALLEADAAEGTTP
jgi:hypothetical protein